MAKTLEGKDAFGQDIKAGDLVAFPSPGKSSLKEGTIRFFQDRNVSIVMSNMAVTRRIDQVVKLSNELRLMRILES